MILNYKYFFGFSIFQSASNEVDDKEEPHPLWEYPSSPLTKPVPLIKFDFTQPLIGMKTVQRQGIINFCR